MIPTAEEYDAYMQAREKLVREDQVRFEQLHIVRKELKKCFWAEGTNYNTVCNDLAVLYLRMLRASKANGVPAFKPPVKDE